MDIRIAGLAEDSIVDGPGCRLTVFTQGCPHHCPGCHNPQSHDFAGGSLTTTEKLIQQMRCNPLLSGVTLSGGEPFCQPLPCRELAEAAHALRLNVWCYTGYRWEDLLNENDPDRIALLRSVDVLVDGPFLLNERSLELTYRGSRNQRLIDVPTSLALGRPSLWQQPAADNWDVL